MATMELALPLDADLERDDTAPDTLSHALHSARAHLLFATPWLIPLLLLSLTNRIVQIRPWWTGWVELGLSLPPLLAAVRYLVRDGRQSFGESAVRWWTLLPSVLASVTATTYSFILMTSLTLHHATISAQSLTSTPALAAAGASVLWLMAELRMRCALADAQGTLFVPNAPVRVVSNAGECIKDHTLVAARDLVRVVGGERFPMDGWVVGGSSEELRSPGGAEVRQLAIGDYVLGGGYNGTGELLIECADHAEERGPLAKLLDGRLVRQLSIAQVGLAALVFFWWAFRYDPASAVMPTVGILLFNLPSLFFALHHLPTRLLSLRYELDEVLVGPLARTQLVVVNAPSIATAEPRITSVVAFHPHDELEVLSIAAQLESRSEHPVARAIRCETQRRDLHLRQPQSVRSFEGGVEGEIGNEKYFVGSLSFARSRASHVDQLISSQALSTGVVVVGRKDKVIGWIGVLYEPDPSSGAAVQTLQQLSVNVVLASGEHETVVKRLADASAIQAWHASVDTAQKHALLAELRSHQTKGSTVMLCQTLQQAPAVDLAVVCRAGARKNPTHLTVTTLSDFVSALSHVRKTLHQSKFRLVVVSATAAATCVLVATTSGVASLWVAMLGCAFATLLVPARLPSKL